MAIERCFLKSFVLQVAVLVVLGEYLGLVGSPARPFLDSFLVVFCLKSSFWVSSRTMLEVAMENQEERILLLQNCQYCRVVKGTVAAF